MHGTYMRCAWEPTICSHFVFFVFETFAATDATAPHSRYSDFFFLFRDTLMPPPPRLICTPRTSSGSRASLSFTFRRYRVSLQLARPAFYSSFSFSSNRSSWLFLVTFFFFFLLHQPKFFTLFMRASLWNYD